MRHATRIAAIWLIASIIVEILVGVMPIPSPTGSSEALGEHQTVYMLFYVGAPIFVFIWVMLLYCLIVFRRHAGDPDEERPAPPDSTPILLLWAGLSFIIVLCLAGWGTFTLHEITQQPKPSAVLAQTHSNDKTSRHVVLPGAKPMDVQVIGQQWFWTFRYPTYGAMETRDLYLPVNTPIHFHITSLDVVHSFWIYDYDVKEDAVPGVDNTAWMLAKTTSAYNPNGRDWVKCNELCGIWHGYMRNRLYVLSQSNFKSWAQREYSFEKSSGLLKNLPPYSSVYYPSSNSNWPTAPQDQSP